MRKNSIRWYIQLNIFGWTQICTFPPPIAHAFLSKSASKINSHFNTPFERARFELPENCKISEIGLTELKFRSFKVSISAICTGFNVNEQLSSGWTALLHACDTDREEMVNCCWREGPTLTLIKVSGWVGILARMFPHWSVLYNQLPLDKNNYHYIKPPLTLLLL